MNNSIFLTALSEAGGVGKTTIAVNLAYEWYLRGSSVLIIDLDRNHSLEDFVGLDAEEDLSKTSALIFDSSFEGHYPFKYVLDTKRIAVCQGHEYLKDISEQLVSRRRREYILQKAIAKYPIENFDLVIFDCRAGFDLLSQNALVASTHLLIPIHMGVKSLTAARIAETIYREADELELEPAPKILGFLPNHYNHRAVEHQKLLKALYEVAEDLALKMYEPIKVWQHLNNSAIYGQTLKQIRPSDPINKVFSSVVDDLKLIQNFNN